MTTLAGSGVVGFIDGIPSNAKFSTPCGVAVDSSGHVYVADTYNNRIRAIAGIIRNEQKQTICV